MSAQPESFPLTRALLGEGVSCIQAEFVVGAEESAELSRQLAAALAELDEAAARLGLPSFS